MTCDKTGLYTSVTRLQEQCYVIISDFVFTRDKSGRLRGWGAAEYSTPEKTMGSFFTENVYKHTPEESYHRLVDFLCSLLPNASEKDIKKLLH